MLQVAKLTLLFLALFIAGCGPGNEGVTDRSLVSPEVQAKLPEPTDSIGRLWFSPLEGWPSRPPKIGSGIVMFAPENDAWTAMGFRPNLAVKIRDNPGINLDDLYTLLEDSLAKNVQELNTTLFVEARPVLDSEGRSLTIEDIKKFELAKSSLGDGYPCVESVSIGAFNLDGKIIRTKTLAVGLLDSANTYTATIIIPMSHEKELTQDWNRFKQTLRFRE